MSLLRFIETFFRKVLLTSLKSFLPALNLKPIKIKKYSHILIMKKRKMEMCGA